MHGTRSKSLNCETYSVRMRVRTRRNSCATTWSTAKRSSDEFPANCRSSVSCLLMPMMDSFNFKALCSTSCAMLAPRSHSAGSSACVRRNPMATLLREGACTHVPLGNVKAESFSCGKTREQQHDGTRGCKGAMVSLTNGWMLCANPACAAEARPEDHASSRNGSAANKFRGLARRPRNRRQHVNSLHDTRQPWFTWC